MIAGWRFSSCLSMSISESEIVSACDTTRGIAMGDYGGKVIFTYTGKRSSILPDRRVRERFAESLLRLSRCRAYAWWLHNTMQISWRVVSSTATKADQAHYKPPKFVITLEPVGNDDEYRPFVSSDSLTSFENKMGELAAASLNFLLHSSAYTVQVNLQLM